MKKMHKKTDKEKPSVFLNHKKSKDFLDKRKLKHLKNVKKRNIRKKYKLVHRLTRMNNKSRKGVYIGIRSKDLKKERLYKWKPEYGVNYYNALFSEGAIKKKKKGVKARGWEQKEKYLEKIRKRGKMDEWFNKGMGESVIENVKTIDRYKIKQAYRTMIKPLLSERYRNDRLVIETFSNEENIKKLKERIEINIEIFGEKGKYVKLTSIGKTLEEITPLLKVNLGHNDLHKKDLDGFKEKGFIVETSTGVDLSEYDKPMMNKIISSKIKLIFRKG